MLNVEKPIVDKKKLLLSELRCERIRLQGLIALANLAGDKESAHSFSKELCRVMEIQFQLTPRRK